MYSFCERPCDVDKYPKWPFYPARTSMTTIAYRRSDRQMAADTQVTCGSRKLRCSKVKRLKCGGLIGSSGKLADIMKVHRWAEAGFKEADAPDFGDESGEFECLVVHGNGDVFLLDEEMELLPFTDDFIAAGSGGAYATAAMDCGHSPEEAVRIAAKYDASTSEPVETFTLTKPKPARKPVAKVRKRSRA